MYKMLVFLLFGRMKHYNSVRGIEHQNWKNVSKWSIAYNTMWSSVHCMLFERSIGTRRYFGFCSHVLGFYHQLEIHISEWIPLICHIITSKSLESMSLFICFVMNLYLVQSFAVQMCCRCQFSTNHSIRVFRRLRSDFSVGILFLIVLSELLFSAF